MVKLSNKTSMRIISGSSNPELAAKIANKLNIPLVDTEISEFANGEKRVWIKEKLDGQDVIVVQSFSHPVDEHIMEFLLMLDALERMGARDVHVIVPWMGYSLQDKVFRPGEAIAAKVVARLISHAYVKRVYLIDVHNTSIPGFFDIPCSHLSAIELFAADVRERFDIKDIVVASPDFGGLKRARQFANLFDVPLVNIDKHRDLVTGKVTALGLHGRVKGKIVVLFDDVILSGGTVTEAGDMLKEEGAKEAHFFATHGLFTGTALANLAASSMDSITVANTIAHPNLPKKIQVLDLAPMMAETLEEWF